MKLLAIREGGFYPEIALAGNGEELYRDGVEIDAPGQTVLIGRFRVSKVRYPLIVKRVGRLIIQDYMPHSFWGDTFQFRTGNITIDRLAPQNILRIFSYEELHQDIIGQMFTVKEDGWTLDPDGVIENVTIHDICVTSALADVNGLMLSERNVYRNIQLGLKRLHVGIEAPYWFSTNNLQDSVIGGRDSVIYSPSGNYQPTVRVQNVKGSPHASCRSVVWNVPYADQAVLDDGVVSV